MSLRDDERGQAIQVGAVLLFAILIVAFSTYQAVIIPADNRRVEFNHNQEVQEQLADLRNAVLSAAGADGSRSVTVALGTQYPSRTLGLNPNSPAGSLRTVGTADPLVNLTIENAVATNDETDDFWNGDPVPYETGAIRYSPNYNRYDEAPTTTYEHSVLYNQFSAGNTLVLANQTLIDENRISIVTIDGSLDRTSSRSTSVDVRPISASSETVSLEPTGSNDPITISFTSLRDEEAWNRTIPNDADVTVDESTSPAGSEYHRIRLTLTGDGPYHLGMTKAAVGQGATNTDEAYLTTVDADSSVRQGENATITLAVRDAYNNPVSGVQVASSFAGWQTTGGDGRVTFEYDSSGVSPGQKQLDFAMGQTSVPSGGSFDAGTPENVSVEIEVNPSGGGVGGGVYALSWADPSSQPGVECPNGPDDTCSIDASQTTSVVLTSTTSPSVTGASLDYALNDSSVGSLNPWSGETNSMGENDTTLDILDNDDLDVYVTAGSGGDTITFAITNQVADLIYNDDATAEDGPDGDMTEGGVEFTMTNQFDQDATITEITINETGGPVSSLNDEATPNGQPGTSEVYLASDVDDGWVDVNGGFDLPVTVDLDQDGFDNGPNPTVSSDGTFTVFLFEFENNGGNRIDMSGQSFSVTFEYELADGTTGQKKVDITVP